MRCPKNVWLIFDTRFDGTLSMTRTDKALVTDSFATHLRVIDGDDDDGKEKENIEMDKKL